MVSGALSEAPPWDGDGDAGADVIADPESLPADAAADVPSVLDPDGALDAPPEDPASPADVPDAHAARLTANTRAAPAVANRRIGR
jgi:hypothetical protein